MDLMAISCFFVMTISNMSVGKVTTYRLGRIIQSQLKQENSLMLPPQKVAKAV